MFSDNKVYSIIGQYTVWINFAQKVPRTHNSKLAIGGVSSPLDSFLVAESSVFRINFCGNKPAHQQSANRCASV
jgi:hypothetical protein